MGRGWAVKPQLYRRRDRYRTVVLEAMGPVTYDNAASIAYWCGGGVNRRLDQVAVRTPLGVVVAELGDYVVRDRNGCFCPCAGDVFAESHEPV